MASDKKTSWILFLCVVILLSIFKWADIYRPYFWDELGVYSRAISFQAVHGPSLMPASLPPELSRGHPLFFTCINAVVARIFGLQVFVGHIFCFFVSVLLLLAVYLKIGKYFNPITGIISCIVLAIQPLFLAQSCLVLPEITLTFFAFVAICSYYENNFLLFAIYASLAILTKEAAIVLPAAVIGYSLLKWWMLKSKPQGFKWRSLLFTIIPYLVFGLFLLIQKHQNGWFFFPLHIDSVKLDFNVFGDQIQRFGTFIFKLQGRIVLTIILIVGSLVALLKGKFSIRGMADSFLLPLVVLTVAFLVFNSLVDLYMERYGMFLLTSFAICVGVTITTISTNKVFGALILILLTIVSCVNFEDRFFHYDADLGYRKELNVLQQAIDFIADNQKPNERAVSNFPGGFALRTGGGYLKGRKVNYLTDAHSDSPYYFLMCDPGSSFQIDTANSTVVFLKEFSDGYAHSRIYYVTKK